MKRSTLVSLGLSLLCGTPALAVRGVEPGRTRCDAARSIEARLGSTRKGASLPPGTTDPGKMFFDGAHLGSPAVISYGCEAGVVEYQMIRVRFSHEQEAQVAFSDFRRALIAEVGAPSKDLDELAVSELQEKLQKDPIIASTGDEPLQRFATWVAGHRLLALTLSGDKDSWEILLSDGRNRSRPEGSR